MPYKYKYNSERLADAVREYRTREGLSLQDLAERVQSSAATLSRIENRTAKLAPDTDTLLRVMAICDLTLNEIFQSDDANGKAQIQDISTQLRASSELSAPTRQALAAIIHAVRIQLSDRNTQDTEK